MKFEKWIVGDGDADAAGRLRGAGYPGLLSSVLAARGVGAPEEAALFLERERCLTHSPLLMKDMDRAVARIQRAIAGGERVAVFGDYDVDGITSTVLLMDYLKSCGAKCLRYIPRRIEDGYGLSKPAIQSLRDQGATLMITVDCGISDVRAVARARELGFTVVVSDHHMPPETLPDAHAITNPRLSDDNPCPHLAGVGVAFFLMGALNARLEALSGKRMDMRRVLDLVALGTLADMVSLTGQNRILVKNGLLKIAEAKRPGLAELKGVSGFSPNPFQRTGGEIGPDTLLGRRENLFPLLYFKMWEVVSF